MSLRRKLFTYTFGFSFAIIYSIGVIEDIRIKKNKHLYALDLLEKDLKGEINMRKDPSQEFSLLSLIFNRYKGKWVSAITSYFSK